MRIHCFMLMTAIMLMPTVTFAGAGAFKLTDADVERITRLCGAGGTSSHVNADIRAAVSAWKQKVVAKGAFERSEVPTILSNVKEEQHLASLLPSHQQCVQNVLFKLMDAATSQQKVVSISPASSQGQVGSNSEIEFSHPQCTLEQGRAACYARAVAKNRDNSICIDGEKTRVLSQGKHINADLIYAGLWKGGSPKIDLVQDIPVNLGAEVHANQLAQMDVIDLLEIKTCEGQSIKFKNFSKSGTQSTVYRVLE